MVCVGFHFPLFSLIRLAASCVGTYAAFPTDCSVKNSFMAELGYYDKQVAGVFISNSQRINASHNMIRNVPRAGILLNDG